MEEKLVKESRKANGVEQEAIYKALAEMGEMQCLGDGAWVYGRYDAPYGWYLIGLDTGVEGDEGEERYMILGDCLDVLPDYGKLLTLADVVNFAWGCADLEVYNAIQEWGVFNSISNKMSIMLDEHDVCMEGETAKWDATRKEWRLTWEVIYKTEAGVECHAMKISIPAHTGSRGDADKAFAESWKEYKESFDKSAVVSQEVAHGIDEGEAEDFADSQYRAIERIDKLVQGYVKFGLVEIDDKSAPQKDLIWVLTIREHGRNYPELHETYEGAVEGARKNFMNSTGVTDEDWKKVKSELEEHLWFYCEDNDCEYDLTECPVCK